MTPKINKWRHAKDLFFVANALEWEVEEVNDWSLFVCNFNKVMPQLHSAPQAMHLQVHMSNF